MGWQNSYFLKFGFFNFFGMLAFTPTMHTHQRDYDQGIRPKTFAKACESRLWSHTSSPEGWGIRRALGLGSCGRDGRAYLIDPPQFLATSEFLRCLQGAALKPNTIISFRGSNYSIFFAK